MERNRLATILGFTAAVLWFASMGLHTAGYARVTEMAAKGGEDVRALMGCLWLAFSAAMIATGLIVSLNARATMPRRRQHLIYCALVPIMTAILQVIFLGWIFPVYILGSIGVLAVASAVLGPAPVGTVRP